MGAHVIDILITVGPLFSINRLIGKARVLAFEHLLLALLHVVARSYPRLLRFSRLVPVFAIPELVFVVGLAVLDVFVAAMGHFQAPQSEMLDLTIVGFAFVIVFLARQTLAVVTNHMFFDKLTDFNAEWHADMDGPPPFPLNSFPAVYERKAIGWWRLTFPLVVVWFALMVPLLWVLTLLLFAPFWCADQIRRKLNPSNESFLDILAYLISLGAMVYKLI